MYWRRKLTRLELGIYACVIGAAIALFVERLLDHMELAERTAMEVTITRVNSGATLARAYAIMKGQPDAGAARSPANPFVLAGVSPRNYLGVLDGPELPAIERGNWLFDHSKGELVYLPRLHRGLRIDDPDRAIRFRWESKGGGGILVPTSPYDWR